MNQTEPHVFRLRPARHRLSGHDDEHGPDFAKGILLDTIPQGGVLTGRVGGDPVILT